LGLNYQTSLRSAAFFHARKPPLSDYPKQEEPRETSDIQIIRSENTTALRNRGGAYRASSVGAAHSLEPSQLQIST
jgi:hypothetical protein